MKQAIIVIDISQGTYFQSVFSTVQKKRSTRLGFVAVLFLGKLKYEYSHPLKIGISWVVMSIM